MSQDEKKYFLENQSFSNSGNTAASQRYRSKVLNLIGCCVSCNHFCSHFEWEEWYSCLRVTKLTQNITHFCSQMYCLYHEMWINSGHVTLESYVLLLLWKCPFLELLKLGLNPLSLSSWEEPGYYSLHTWDCLRVSKI